MGRKNNRVVTGQDKNWDKFIKSVVSENPNKDTVVSRRMELLNNIKSTPRFTTSPTSPQPKQPIDYAARNKERLDYAIKQFNSLGIKYDILDESLTLMVCYHKQDNTPIKYYASSGCVIGYPDSRGIKALLSLLLN